MAENIENVLLQKAQVDISMNQLSELQSFKNQTAQNFKTFSNSVGKGFGFSIKNFQNNLNNIFSNIGKNFTTPFKNISTSLSNVFGSFRNTLNKLNPIALIKNNVGEKVTAAKQKLAVVMGKDLESLQKTYYKKWANPKTVAEIQWGVYRALDKKAWKKEQKNNQATNIPFISTMSYENLYYKNWAKPQKTANIWAKEFKRTLYPNAKKNAIATATTGQVLATLEKSITKIAKSVTWFFSGGGFGIGLAVGLTPPVLLICGAIAGLGFLLLDFLKPVRDNLLETSEWFKNTLGESILHMTQSIESVVNSVSVFLTKFMDLGTKLLSIFDSPISSVAKGVKSVVSNITTTLKPDYTVAQDQDINTMLFNIYNNLDSKYLMPARRFVTNTLHANYLKPMLENQKDQNIILKNILEKNMADTTNGSGLMSSISSGFSSLKNSLKSAFTREEKQTVNGENIVINNSFDELIKGFNTMKTDTIKLLGEIKTAVLEVSTKTIQIGTFSKDIGKGYPTDNKIKDVNVTVNPTINIQDILSRMDNMNTKLEKIVTNTGITDSGDIKNNAATWTVS